MPLRPSRHRPGSRSSSLQGRFEPGSYRLEIELDRDTRIRAHLIAEDFDLALEESLTSENGKAATIFDIEEAGTHYLRLYLDTPARVIRVGIHPAK